MLRVHDVQGTRTQFQHRILVRFKRNRRLCTKGKYQSCSNQNKQWRTFKQYI